MLTPGPCSEVAEELDEVVEQLLAPTGDRVAGRLREHGQAVGVGEHPEAEEDHDHGEHALVHGVRPVGAGEGGTGTSPLVPELPVGLRETRLSRARPTAWCCPTGSGRPPRPGRRPRACWAPTRG